MPQHNRMTILSVAASFAATSEREALIVGGLVESHLEWGGFDPYHALRAAECLSAAVYGLPTEFTQRELGPVYRSFNAMLTQRSRCPVQTTPDTSPVHQHAERPDSEGTADARAT